MIRIDQEFTIAFRYPVIFTRGVFAPENMVLGELLATSGCTAAILPVIDQGVLDACPQLPERIAGYLGARGWPVLSPAILPGGERCKRGQAAGEGLQELIGRNGLCRHSYVLAIGGGALLDTAGFAAATAHRGVRLIRMPTTTLAQNDAGIGVKNGVNAFGRKNFVGTFAPPFAVINDFEFLKTLPVRELRAGIAEAVKVALIRDAAFFSFLFEARSGLRELDPAIVEQMIIRGAELHLEHIRDGDPFETGSSRPLDFGHWSAHVLEAITGGSLRHGEAVAIGIGLDALYSCRAGLLAEQDLARIFLLLETAGFRLFHESLFRLPLAKALAEFREHLGGRLTIPLLTGIGKSVATHEPDLSLYQSCIRALALRAGAGPGCRRRRVRCPRRSARNRHPIADDQRR